MRNRIFEIVVFLIDYVQGDLARLTDADDIWITLESQGYSVDEISSAYSWLLKRYEGTQQHFFSSFSQANFSNRILTATERNHLTVEAYGFLLKLLNTSVIDNEQFETIMEHVAMYVPKPVDVEQIKVIASSVIFSELNELDSLALLEVNEDHNNLVN